MSRRGLRAYRADYYDYEEPPRRRRPVWPWLLGILVLAGALVAGFYVWNQIQDEISGAKPVIVPFVEGQRWPEARQNIRRADLRPIKVNRAHEAVALGIVFRQAPEAGERVPKGNAVRIFVSTGKPRIAVPDVLGAREADAVVTLRAAGLVPDTRDIFSDKPPGTETAQDPKGGTKRCEGHGPDQHLQGPAEHRHPKRDRALLRPGRRAAAPGGLYRGARGRRFIRAAWPDHRPGSGPRDAAPPGTEVTLSVSTGKESATVPEVVGQDEESARASLENEGWQVTVRCTGTDDPAEDGIVISQNPAPGAEAEARLDRHPRRGPARGRRTAPATVTAASSASHAMSKRVRVAVIAGGRSSRHEISVASARSVIDALDPDRYDIQTIGIGRDGRWELNSGAARELERPVAETLPVPTAGF